MSQRIGRSAMMFESMGGEVKNVVDRVPAPGVE
jgi:hypothetical protein